MYRPKRATLAFLDRAKQAVESGEGALPVPLFQVKPYKPATRVSAVTLDSIRITGSRQFCDAVLSRLADIMTEMEDSDNHLLDISYSEMTDRDDGKLMEGQFAVYAFAQERGSTGATFRRRIERGAVDPDRDFSQREPAPTPTPTSVAAPVTEEGDKRYQVEGFREGVDIRKQKKNGCLPDADFNESYDDREIAIERADAFPQGRVWDSETSELIHENFGEEVQ